MGEFNFNSQICTDKNQSERLLALGLKKETADMHWRLQPYYNDEGFDCGLEWSCNIGTFLQENACELFFDYIPAWSLHRLIEMIPENVSDDWLGVSFDEISYYHGEGKDMIGWKYYKAGNLYDCIIECYEWLIENGSFKKEYLCEK